jgi:formylglycine-generating enzyme
LTAPDPCARPGACRLVWMLCAALTGPAALAASSTPAYVQVAGGSFLSLLPPDGKQAKAQVGDFSMRVLPVSNAEFARFTQNRPAWRRNHVAGTTLADAQYLQGWPASTQGHAWPDKAQRSMPATAVSWFAAQAYCEAEGAHLPTWHQWEYVAAADATRRDARADPLWRARILDWYGQTSKVLPAVGSTAKNAYAVQDMHGVIWEWVEDFGALMVSGDNRTQGDPDVVRFCGAGAISANDRENYPVLMRMAMLSSLSAASTNRNLGFRCVRDRAGLPGNPTRKSTRKSPAKSTGKLSIRSVS